jgi:hypothetical protein
MTNTSKISAIALAALVAGAAAVTPVLANGFDNEASKLFDNQYYLTQLRYEGINAISADEVTNSVFRATVVTADGHTVFEFFDRDSLQQIKQ